MQYQNEIIIFTNAIKEVFEFYKFRAMQTQEVQTARTKELEQRYCSLIFYINSFLIQNNLIIPITQRLQHLNTLLSAIDYWPIRQDLPDQNYLPILINRFFMLFSLSPTIPENTKELSCESGMILNNLRPSLFGSSSSHILIKANLTDDTDIDDYLRATKRVYDFLKRHRRNISEFSYVKIFDTKKLGQCVVANNDEDRKKVIRFIKEFLKQEEFIDFNPKFPRLTRITKPLSDDQELRKKLETFLNKKNEDGKTKGNKKRTATEMVPENNGCNKTRLFYKGRWK